MKSGDLVSVHDQTLISAGYELGIILDSYEDDDGIVYFEIKWNDDVTWHNEYEIKVLCES